MNDIVEAFKTIVPSAKSSKYYSRSVEAMVGDKDWDSGTILSKSFTILFWVGLSLICLVLCATIGWQMKKLAQGHARSATSRSRSRSRNTNRSVFQTPPSHERAESIWSKVFSKGQGESKRWPAIRRFASRSRSQAGDVEMQRVQPVGSTVYQPGDWRDTASNPVQPGPALQSSAQRTRRLRRLENLPADRGCTMGWRAEAERQRLRDAWHSMEVRGAEAYLVTPLQQLGSQPRADSQAVAQPNAGRIGSAAPPVYESARRAESPAPSILEVPPPTYAEHTGDEVADLSDYQRPAHAAEEIRDVQGLPPYASSAPDVAAPGIVLLPRHPAWRQNG